MDLFCIYLVGVNDDEGPPVPIPNTVVKLISAENTWREAAREDRSAPTYIFSSIAQSVEHAAVNRRVVGSSPTWGAKESLENLVFSRLFPCVCSARVITWWWKSVTGLAVGTVSRKRG